MIWSDLLAIRISLIHGVEVQIGILSFVIFLAVVMIGLYIWKRNFSNWNSSSFEVNLGSIGTVTITRNYDVARIAHKAWTEMQTRKGALPFDEDHDVIIEVYDSWYSLFKEFRSLLKDIPAELISKDHDTKLLVEQMINVLNIGLRPHLTKWQARMRRWMHHTEKTSEGKSFQEIQRDFPDYRDLVTDLKTLNGQLQEYSVFLGKIAHAK